MGKHVANTLANFFQSIRNERKMCFLGKNTLTYSPKAWVKMKIFTSIKHSSLFIRSMSMTEKCALEEQTL